METQASVTEWANQTFGKAPTVLSIAIRANQEMAELLRELSKPNCDEEKAAIEAADVEIILMRVFSALGRDRDYMIQHKMNINRRRQ